ncbi:hypothetical protein B484DRAFT_128920 [Ochromonadaceae sp. CCMP2298]|nr:hypothetical protein B484DRAFT_128920 [Ochromonadaceae sp. CCMP2298]
MACQSTTVELRGQYEVHADTAGKDAAALFSFLQRRGYVLLAEGEVLPPAPPLLRPPSPLTGVDMIQAEKAGILSWSVNAGQWVKKGDLLGEILDPLDAFAEPLQLHARTDGLVYGMRWDRLAVPGDVVIKVAGDLPLEWRKGYLLTSR